MKKFSSILDYTHPGLDTQIWNTSGKLKSEHRDFILETLQKVFTQQGFGDLFTCPWVEQIKIIGSITTYQYTSSTDIDAHIVVNLPEFIKLKPAFTEEQAHEWLDALRKQINESLPNLPNTSHPLEFYFETPFVNKNGLVRSGLYDLIKDEWVVPPVSVNADFDIEELKPFLIDLANSIAEEMDISFGKIKRQIHRIEDLQEAINSWEDNHKQKLKVNLQKRLQEIEQEIDHLVLEKDEIALKRREYSPDSEQEIVFKYLQKFGYLWMISQLEKLVTDDKLTEDKVPKVKEIIKHEASNPFPTRPWAWISPSGEFYDVGNITHVEFIDKNPNLFNINPENKQQYHVYTAINDGWVRVAGFLNKNLLLEAASLDFAKASENYIFSVLNKITGIELDITANGSRYSSVYATAADFKEYGWDAFSKRLRSAQILANYDFSSTQVNLPKDMCEQVIAWGKKNIPDSDLYEGTGEDKDKYGRELECHATILYGLHTNNDKDVAELFKDEKSIRLNLGKTDFFEPKDKPYDVVIVNVESKDLHKLNKILRDNLEFTNDFPKYEPHVTIAYVKRGLGKKYKNLDVLNGEEVSTNKVVFSPAKGDRITLTLTAAKNNLIEVGKTLNRDKVFVPQDLLDSYLNSIKQMHTRYTPVLDDLRSELHTELTAFAVSHLFDVQHVKIPPTENALHNYENYVRGIISDFAEDVVSKSLDKDSAFTPGISPQAPNNKWQSDSDVEIPVDPDSISDEETYINPIVDKPRKGVWQRILDMFQIKQEKHASKMLGEINIPSDTVQRFQWMANKPYQPFGNQHIIVPMTKERFDTWIDNVEPSDYAAYVEKYPNVSYLDLMRTFNKPEWHYWNMGSLKELDNGVFKNHYVIPVDSFDSSKAQTWGYLGDEEADVEQKRNQILNAVQEKHAAGVNRNKIKQLLEKVDFIDSDDDVDVLIKQAQNFFSSLGSHPTVYRNLVVSNAETFLIDISEGRVGNYSGVGLWWSLLNTGEAQKRTFDVHYHDIRKGDVIRLKGLINSSDIDWDETLFAYIVWPEEQGIKLKPGSSITISKVDIISSKDRRTNKSLVQNIDWVVTASQEKTPNTTWDSLEQDNEPFKPLPVTYSPETNEENLGKYPYRFMKRPTGPNYSNEGDVDKMLFKQKRLSKHDKKASNDFRGWVLPNGNFVPVGDTMHSWFAVTHPQLFGLTKEEAAKYRVFEEKKQDIMDDSKGIVPAVFQKGAVRISGLDSFGTFSFDTWSLDTSKNADNVVYAAISQGAKKLALDTRSGYYEANVRDFKVDGWDAFSRARDPVFSKLCTHASLLKLDKDVMEEVKTKTGDQIDRETAIKWGNRALAVYQRILDEDASMNHKVAWLVAAQDFYHEALEHASLTDDVKFFAEIRKDVDTMRLKAEKFINDKLSSNDKEASTYSDKEMEEIYTKEHEYNDSTGGGNVYHDWNQSTTDFPKVPAKPKVTLDQLTPPPNGVIPSYEVTWLFSVPKNE